ncbi:MAG: oxidoreductase [Bacteroidales bacterium]|nr:oxidoreductase [Bacteroidales bacterium]
MEKHQTTIDRSIKVQRIRQLTQSAYVLRFDRNGIDFTAGQHVILGIKDQNNAREYSVYSAEQDNYFEVLIKEVLEGDVSKKLKKLSPGAQLQMDGPLGFFTLNPEKIKNSKFILIATGTGIAPFRSFVRSYPQLNYTLIHGVRYAHEAYEQEEYNPSKFILCTTGDKNGDFHGRVTDYLLHSTVDPKAEYYLCGNVKMIHEAFDILAQKGVKTNQLHSEVYF